MVWPHLHSRVDDVSDFFGEALLDYHQGDRQSPFEWERSDGVRIVQPLGVYYEGFKPLESAGMANLQGRVLDIGCGAGKHALECVRRGHSCSGIDLSPLAIRVCRERGLRELHVADALACHLPSASFDSFTLFSNNLSIGGTLAGVARLLREAARLANAGARLISVNRDVSHSRNADDCRYREENRRVGKPPGQIRMRARYKGRHGPWFDWLFVSPTELTEWAPATGWRVTHVVSGSGGDYCAVLDRSPPADA
jgi:SAM-dependent methyltransferase